MLQQLVVIICAIIIIAECQVNLVDYFGNCRKGEVTFDDCVMNGLNALRPYYVMGIPEMGVSPLDPFFALEVPQKRQGPFYNYKLILRNVTESGWTVSKITKLKTDFNGNSIQYTQFFPDKRLNGWYEFDGTFFGRKVANKGSWNLSLFDFVQTTTVTRKMVKGLLKKNPPLDVKVSIEKCRKLELHIGNLAGGRTIVENMLDWIINTAWQPGFVVLSPLINDLVSTAFTEIFDKNFRNFPFDKIFPK